MKNDRQTAVLQIIEETAVETQEQLMQLLAERGFACTQATVFPAAPAAASTT